MIGSERPRIGLRGLGSVVPPQVVGNDDARFAVSRAAQHDGVSEAELFTGLAERRRIADDATVEDLAVDAARAALADAGIAADRIDRLYGYVSPSAHLSPNGLYRVHRALGLRRDALVLPIQTEFTNFIAGSLLAAEAIAAGHAGHALVACAAGWTRNMDYRSPHAVSIGDGAAAAVVGPSDRFTILDSLHEVYGEDEHTMVLDLTPDGTARFALSDAGVRSFLTNGVTVPPRLVATLLARHGISPDRVALITHQASRRLMDAWQAAIGCAEYPSTLDELGNMTLATVGVTLARFAARIRSEYVVLVALGLGTHFSALLLAR